MKAINRTKTIVLADELMVADTVLTRLVGLLGKCRLESGKGLLITPCKGVHSLGMRFPIDVLFVSKDNIVVAMEKNLQPWRMTRFYCDAVRVLELPAGIIGASSTQIGDELELA